MKNCEKAIFWSQNTLKNGLSKIVTTQGRPEFRILMLYLFENGRVNANFLPWRHFLKGADLFHRFLPLTNIADHSITDIVSSNCMTHGSEVCKSDGCYPNFEFQNGICRKKICTCDNGVPEPSSSCKVQYNFDNKANLNFTLFFFIFVIVL